MTAPDEFDGQRAITDGRKYAICERLYFAWLEVPSLRLGQLIVDACGTDPYHKEDEPLISEIETFVQAHTRQVRK